ncbi:MAG: hypothetical protein IPK81_24170 [Rhodospirillales bacterium]|nr:MAG: hypothetical protein IPK81_24170 [Rhodospirillales bacterium]
MKAICKVCRRAALLTCVTNLGGIGPGHSAIVLDSTVYTFENVRGSWFVSGSSGWREVSAAAYFAENVHRPVVVQELDAGAVDASAIHAYIVESDLGDADYLSSGVCSQQAINAISAGVKGGIGVWGPNFPWEVYKAVQSSGLVSSGYYTFPWRDRPKGCNPVAVGLCLSQLNMAYRPENNTRKEPPPVLKW